jgi:hypothetical protein
MNSLAAGMLLISALSSACLAQWTLHPSPCYGSVYDSSRDRVFDHLNVDVQEFDGTTWQVIPNSSFGFGPRFCQEFDAVRGRIIAVDLQRGGLTGEWDGVSWQVASVTPYPLGVLPHPYWGFPSTFHSGRGKVVMLCPPQFSMGAELFEWDGASWALIQTNQGPPVGGPFVKFVYFGFAYDARRDKLALFGRADIQTGSGLTLATAPELWEWDAANGWIQLPNQSGANPYSDMWFDERRGSLIRLEDYYTPNASIWVRRDNGTWALSSVGPSPLGIYRSFGGRDTTRDRCYGVATLTPTTGCYITSMYPADYGPHGSGCGASTPELALQRPWTRPWTGGTLAVEVTPAPQSIAALFTGFSDQTYGATALPANLAPYGMPGCFLHAAPQYLQMGIGTNGIVGFQLPVPDITGLIGVQFWQQAFVFDITANPAGILASNSMRGRVGRSH